jgi:hypothetical protein
VRAIDRHARYRELLAARLDRSLTRAENRLLVSHLKGCQDCQRVERDYRDQSSLLRSMSAPVPPRDMWARTSTALDREMSRWPYRYPRVSRRVLRRDDRSRSNAPSAMATVVAAVGVVTALVVIQLAPSLSHPAGTGISTADGATAAAALRPTPFAVSPQSLALIASTDNDLTVYQTQVSEVCPPTAPDCFNDSKFVTNKVKVSNLRPQNVALSPGGDQIAVVGHNTDKDVIAVVMLRNQEPTRTSEPAPASEPTETPSGGSASSVAPPTDTPAAGETPVAEPTPTQPVADQSGEPSATDASETNEPGPDPGSTPADEPPATHRPNPSLGRPLESPPQSAVPGLTVLSILENVHSAGAPPAWSRDSSALAFSAMPTDGSHGPDVYVWQPGDDQARAVTNDHASYFASWSGRRIVASRVMGDGKTASDVDTVVIDPQTLEERTVAGPAMWLPVVDFQRTNAVTWNGHLDLSGGLPKVRDGALYLLDWSALDPYRTSTADPAQVELVPLDASRNPQTQPVLDWHVRWSVDGNVLGLWEADSVGASWGKLEVLEFDPESGALTMDDPLIGPQLSKRSFTLGSDRVAWVGPSNDGTEGELRVRTWGRDGVGDLRIDSPDLEELVPTF